MSDKLPEGVVLEMIEPVSSCHPQHPCISCYFLHLKCPQDWVCGGFALSCSTGRNVIFKELGDRDERI